LAVEGTKKDHLVAFLRGDTVATLAPRWNLKLGGAWAGTTVDLPLGHWKNVFTSEQVNGGRLRVQTLLQRFPVALFTREGD
jgi:(1->4)-alpha-D-glucan 1-alpha-D-glucosylmutase